MMSEQRYTEESNKPGISDTNGMSAVRFLLLSVSGLCLMLGAGFIEFSLQAKPGFGLSSGLMQADSDPGFLNPDGMTGDTLHIHFISGSDEYESENSLKKFKKVLEEEIKQVRITASWGEDAGDNLPGVQHLADVDLMFVFTRRMMLPDDQLNYIIDHVEAEKPVVGVRTASHAFQGFLELDSLVFGGDYDGHGEEETVEVTITGTAEKHPILKGVRPWVRPGKIYHNPDLSSGAQVLLYGEGLDSIIYEPLAWTHIFGQNGRAFYTSMGLPSDFENENFLQLLLNAISWAAEYP